ncbi:hypothetical protein HY639_02445 [Candidatus Woesearchaeota archaeon]|nr:hypothetical protein [Candidatus Woesearchaeota archaeon]
MQKGQVSFFFILGILLLLSISLLYFLGGIKYTELRTKGHAVTTETAPGFLAVHKLIETCVDQTAKLAVFYLGFIGGDVSPDPWILQSPSAYFSYDQYYRIPYYVYEGRALMLSDEEIKRDILARYMNTKLPKCTNGFVTLPMFRVVEELPSTDVTLTDEEVLFSVTYPVQAFKGDTKENIGPQYVAHVRVRLLDILSIARAITLFAAEDDRLIRWDFMTDVTTRHYNITAYTERDKTLIYRIIDLNNTIDNEPYKYQFGVRVS